MAKIPLRAYIKEIENLIERGEIEQAVAHSRNILKSYPKHIDTYRLLGKAFLESQRYSEAADILQRVLSVMPDDFISQIGMSIIREDEGNLDAAIWHMERAYEVQPFNPAVQDELRRLYGRRDGIEPPKIRLTRGALVRMYARGELYPQAIAETRAALAEDLQRFDLRVLLARLYYLSGHKNDAAEVCSELISKLPYCYEANRLLAEILPTTSRAEDAKKFQQRIYSLDPYEAFISPVSPSSDQVPDQAVMMEQFIWDASAEGTQTPEWTRNIGVQWEETEEENLPDWLNTLKPETSSGLQAGDHQAEVISTPSETETAGAQQNNFHANETDLPEQVASSEEVVPSWLKDAGWSASDKTADEIMALQEESPADEIIPAEIPDWIQSIAPHEDILSEEESTETTEWLDNLLQEPSKGESQQTDEITPDYPTSVQTESESLDWLDDLANEPLSGKIKTENISEPSETNELPDWLSNMQAENKTEFLQEIGEGETSDLPDSWLETGEPEPDAKTPHFNEVPDWLNALDADFSEPSTAGSDAPDWLNAIKDEAGETITEPAQPEAIETTTEPDPSSAMPGWLTQLQNNPDAASIAPQETEEITAERENEDTSAERSDVESAMAWLQALTPHSDVVEEPTSQSGEMEDSTETVPEEAAAEPASSSVYQSAAETLLPESDAQSAPVIDSQPAAETPDFSDMDAAMAWLESLAAKQGADEATLITPPDQRTDTPPEWVLNEIEQQMAVSEETMPEETPEIVQETVQEPEAVESKEDYSALISNEIEEPTDEESGVEVPELEVPTLETLVQETSTPDEPARIELPVSEAAEQQTNEMDMDEAFAWLESLAAKQGADEETLISAPDERSETPPEWIQHQQETAEIAQAEPPVVELSKEEPIGSFNELPDQPPADETPDWLMALEDEPSGQEAEGLEKSFIDQFEDKAAPSPEQIETQGILENAEINPESWISGGEEPSVETDKAAEENGSLPDWLQSETIDQPVIPSQTENLPEWLFGIEENTEIETPSKEEEVPVAPAEYHSEWEPEVNTQPSKQEPTPAPTRAETGASDLSALQDAISHGDLDNALDGYNRMINEGIYLEETIRDLRDALYRYPVDISIWQVLGDAYARNNQLQEALDAYTKAEELLR